MRGGVAVRHVCANTPAVPVNSSVTVGVRSRGEWSLRRAFLDQPRAPGTLANSEKQIASRLPAGTALDRLWLMPTTGTKLFRFAGGAWQQRYAELFGADERAAIHRIIFGELVRDEIRDDSRRIFEAVAARLVARGADCVILGCTEIGMLIGADDSPVPLFDTAALHAAACVGSVA